MMITQKVKIITFKSRTMTTGYEGGSFLTGTITADEQYNEFVENNDFIFVDFKAYENTLVLAYIEK